MVATKLDQANPEAENLECVSDAKDDESAMSTDSIVVDDDVKVDNLQVDIDEVLPSAMVTSSGQFAQPVIGRRGPPSTPPPGWSGPWPPPPPLPPPAVPVPSLNRSPVAQDAAAEKDDIMLEALRLLAA